VKLASYIRRVTVYLVATPQRIEASHFLPSVLMRHPRPYHIMKEGCSLECHPPCPVFIHVLARVKMACARVRSNFGDAEDGTVGVGKRNGRVVPREKDLSGEVGMRKKRVRDEHKVTRVDIFVREDGITYSTHSKHKMKNALSSLHQSSSLMLCFCFSCASSSSRRASSALAAAASCFAGMWYNTTMYRSCK
jgi:hypothetical protein